MRQGSRSERSWWRWWLHGDRGRGRGRRRCRGRRRIRSRRIRWLCHRNHGVDVAGHIADRRRIDRLLEDSPCGCESDTARRRTPVTSTATTLIPCPTEPSRIRCERERRTCYSTGTSTGTFRLPVPDGSRHCTVRPGARPRQPGETGMHRITDIGRDTDLVGRPGVYPSWTTDPDVVVRPPSPSRCDRPWSRRGPTRGQSRRRRPELATGRVT